MPISFKRPKPSVSDFVEYSGFSIVSKLTAFVALAVITTASILNWLNYRFAETNLTAQIHRTLDTIAYDRAMRLNAFAAQKKKEVALIASRTALRKLLAGRLDNPEGFPNFLRDSRSILDDAQASSSEFRAIWVTDPNGLVVTSTAPQHLGREFSNHPDYQRGTEASHLGTPEMVGDFFQAYLTSPVRRADGRYLGVVMVLLDLAGLADLVWDRSGLGESGVTLVASHDGETLRYLLPPTHGSDQIWIAPERAPAMVRAIDDRKPGRNMSRFDGRTVLAAWRPVEYQSPNFRRWGLVVKFDRNEAYAPIAELRKLQWRLELVLLALGICSAFLVARRFTGPLLKIADTAIRVSEGDFDARVAMNRNDELGRLARDINRMIQDISERTAELLHAKENLRFLYEDNPSMYFTVASDGTTLSVNKLVTEELGYTIDDLFGRSVLTLYAEHERPSVKARLDQCLAEPGRIFKWSGRKVRENGQTIWTIETMKALISPEGRMVILIVCRDCTQQKRAEEALYESEERYRGLVEDIPILLCKFRTDGEITFVNNTFCKYFQKSAEQLAGSNFITFIPESDQKTVRDRLSRLTLDCPTQTYEYPVAAPGGGLRWQRWTHRAVFDDTGGIVSFQAIGEDITERKSLEAIMEAIHQGTARTMGAMFFRELTRCLAEFLNVRYASVGRLINANEIATVAVWAGDDWTENVVYPLAGTPCANVIRQSTCFYPKDVQTLFPEDDLAIEMNVDSYMGTPLKNSQGATCGILTVMDVKPMSDVPLLRRVLEVFADRAGSELARREAEEELQILSRAVEASSAVVIIFDPNGIIEYANPKFTEITGYSKQEIVGSPVDILRQGQGNGPGIEEIKERLTTAGEWKGEIQSRKKDGTPYWDRCSISCVRNRDNQITHYVSIQEDITREYLLTEQINYQATHDSLTGLINRHEFERRANRLISTLGNEASEHALCFLDLDQFKVVNDTCGHGAGDEMLRRLARLLLTIVRKHDTLARLGGDEFGILMEQCTLDQAHRVADLLQKAVQDYQFSWEGRNFRVGVSIGLVAIKGGAHELTELLKQADAACYMAKDRGRNRIHVYHSDDIELANRHGEMQWVSRIYRALEEDRLCLVAQPIFSLKSAAIDHYELLLRMTDEQGQLVPPGAFLPAAERYNLISTLDRWVIRQTLNLLSRSQKFLEGIHSFTVNLSGQSIADESFLEYVLDQFRVSNVEGNKICFEITETAAVSNLGKADLFISRFKQLGCAFALDDFGSGVSSFGYLKSLSVDYLKIDGMFVKDIVTDPIDYAMVKAINEIGKVMGMRTIAEFVENEKIKAMLDAIGVDYVQGYGIGKPQPIEELLGRPEC